MFPPGFMPPGFPPPLPPGFPGALPFFPGALNPAAASAAGGVASTQLPASGITGTAPILGVIPGMPPVPLGMPPVLGAAPVMPPAPPVLWAPPPPVGGYKAFPPPGGALPPKPVTSVSTEVPLAPAPPPPQ